jgi:hypothetical protein
MLTWYQDPTHPESGAAGKEGDYKLLVVGLPNKTHEWYVHYLGSNVANGLASSMPDAKAKAEEAMNQYRASQQSS